MDKIEMARTTFEEEFNCAQSVLVALAPELGLEREAALRVAGAFGGGIARTGQTCGAVSGALMALGLKYGQVKAHDKQTKDALYARAQEFMRRFKERHGAAWCKDLLGDDISAPEGLQRLREAGAFDSLCPKFVASAVEIADQILHERQP